MSSRAPRHERPTSDQVLARLQAEAPPTRGRLRVYLGMAPGVGKTFKMLEEAHRRQDRGTDVVVGFVETYGRRHTAALLDGLEAVPRRRIEYRGVMVEEMDTEAVLRRRPRVVLVDELAHTNVPGSPREKRWQDVEIIRDAGIEVISTCNTQHIESVADAVETILGVPVRERVPDEEIHSADEIELVDMSPHALRQRMRHGNVYPPDRAAVALERFFTEGNLTALRDITLRFVAGQVDEQLEGIVSERGLAGLGPVSERVMALVDDSDPCRRALRRAAFLASALRAPFLALVMETPETATHPVERIRRRNENVEYATDLGAEIVRAEADRLVDGVVEMAQHRRITHLVLVHHVRRPLERFLRRSLADQLVDRVPGLEVHLIAREPAGGSLPPPVP